MRQTTFVLLVVVLCSSGCMGRKELTRADALETLKAHSAQLLGNEQAIWDGNLPGPMFNIRRGQDPDCTLHKKLYYAARLANAGILRMKVYDIPRYDEYRPGGTGYEFQVGDPTYVRPSLSLVMGNPEFSAVTGVSQNDTTATVEATIHYTPTPVAEQLTASEQAFQQEFGASESCPELYSLPADVTKSFQFALFDDGWRLQE